MALIEQLDPSVSFNATTNTLGPFDLSYDGGASDGSSSIASIVSAEVLSLAALAHRLELASRLAITSGMRRVVRIKFNLDPATFGTVFGTETTTGGQANGYVLAQSVGNDSPYSATPTYSPGWQFAVQYDGTAATNGANGKWRFHLLSYCANPGGNGPGTVGTFYFNALENLPVSTGDHEAIIDVTYFTTASAGGSIRLTLDGTTYAAHSVPTLFQAAGGQTCPTFNKWGIYGNTSSNQKKLSVSMYRVGETPADVADASATPAAATSTFVPTSMPQPFYSGSATGNSTLLPFASDVTAGSLLQCFVTWDQVGGATCTGLTDTQGNTWVQLPGSPLLDTVDAQGGAYFYCLAAKASGPLTVTATFSASCDYRLEALREDAVSAPVALVASASQYATGVDPTSGATTASAPAGASVFGTLYIPNPSGTTGPGSGFTARVNASNSLVLEDAIQATTGPAIATFTNPTSRSYMAFAAVFASAAAAVAVSAVAATASAAALAPTVTASGASVSITATSATATAAALPPTITTPAPPVIVPPVTIYLGTYWVSLGDLDLGVIEVDGVQWDLEDVQGWGSPGSTLQVTQKPRSHGGWAGAAYLVPRPVALSGKVTAPSSAQLSDAIDRLSEACSLTGTTLTVVEGGRARSCTVRRQGEVLVSWTSDKTATWSIQVTAPDPRKYGPMVSQTAGLPSSSGGVTWPITWPVRWTGVTNSGVLSIPNLGNIDAPVLIRIDGPCVAPSITHIGANGVPEVWATSQTLGAGEFLVIDMENKRVLANGQSSRAGYVTSRGWFSVTPGPNQYGFNAQAFASSARMTVTVPEGAWS